MIIKQQAHYVKAAVLPVHSVSEFTHSCSLTPSSELYEWTTAGNSEWGYRRVISDTAMVNVYSLLNHVSGVNV